MSEKKLAFKVGLFLVISLGVVALLVMKFSKGFAFYVPTYDLILKAENVGGIIPGANVYMAGIPIGSVVSTELDPSGKTVSIRIRILKKYRIYSDALFTIKQAGFLGDQFIAVIPRANQGKLLEHNETAPCESPFDLQEVAQSATGLLEQLEKTAARVTELIARVDEKLLSIETLTNLSATVGNFRVLSERALETVHHLDAFVTTNSFPISQSLSNFSSFSEELNSLSRELTITIITNRSQFTSAIANFEQATTQINELLKRVREGKGLAGALVQNEQMARDLSIIISNLNVLSSNINHKGLWGVIRRPKLADDSAAKPNRSAPYSGRDPRK